MLRRAMLYRPLKLFVAYILVSLCLSFFGPIVYYDFHRVAVGLYMLVFITVFAIGYLCGAETRLACISESTASKRLRRTLRLVKMCIWISLVVGLAEFLVSVSVTGINLNLGSLGQAYVDLYSGYVRNTGRAYGILEIAAILKQLPYQVTVILGVYYFPLLTPKYRGLTAGTIALTIIGNVVGQGKQKQIGDIAIFLASVLAVRYTRVPGPRRRGILRRILLVASLTAMALLVIQKQRYEAVGINAFNYSAKAPWRSALDLSHPLFRVFGYEWGFPLALLSNYIGGGYYGLSLCLQLPFKWTYLIGNSYALMVAANRFLGLPFLLEDTYVLRMEHATGWPGMSRWHTVFAWQASDLTFVGAILLFLPIAYVYAVSWKEAQHGNPVSIMMFSVLTLALVYVPANNQLMHSPGGVIATLVLCVTWFLKHRGFNLDLRDQPST